MISGFYFTEISSACKLGSETPVVDLKQSGGTICKGGKGIFWNALLAHLDFPSVASQPSRLFCNFEAWRLPQRDAWHRQLSLHARICR
jgi:hypothetical protein